MFSSIFNSLFGSKPPERTKKTTDLHRAVIDGNLEAFERFFDTNGSAEIDVLDEDDYTALTLSIIHKRDEMFDRLTKRLADPHIPKSHITHQAFNAAIIHDASPVMINKIRNYSSFYRCNKELITVQKERIRSNEIAGYDFVEFTTETMTREQEQEYEVVNPQGSPKTTEANATNLAGISNSGQSASK